MIFIDGVIFSLQKAGGISVYFCELIKRLVEPYIFFVSKNENKILEEYDIAQSGKLPERSIFLKLTRYLDVCLPSGVTVFHSSYYRLPVFWQRKKVKVVTTVHDFTYEIMGRGLKRKVHSFQKKRAILNSDVVICISENTRADLLNIIPDAANKDIRVIYNGVADDFKPIEKCVVERDYILFVGARSGYKNFDVLVKSLASLHFLDLVIVGGGELDGSTKRYLNSLMPKRYRHVSFVSNEELNVLYNNAFCLVYPSLYEGFGIPVVEAMKAGCPVIAANCSSIPEVSGGSAILIDEISSDKVIDSIFSLQEFEVRQAFIQKGIKNAEKFSWNNTFIQTKNIYFG